MAKTAVINRDQKRRAVVKKFAAKRAELLAIIRNTKLSEDDRHEARLKLQQLPRNASPVRLRNRCALTGRPRGVYRKFGLGRNKRGAVMGGERLPWQCHRFLISDYVVAGGGKVAHLVNAGASRDHRLNPVVRLRDGNLAYDGETQGEFKLEE